jgi:hypothetical protein
MHSICKSPEFAPRHDLKKCTNEDVFCQTHRGTVTGTTTGTGRCYHHYNGTQGALLAASTTSPSNADGWSPGNVYAAAYMIQSSPSMICPYYDRASLTGSASNVYQIVCGYYYTGAGYGSISTNAVSCKFDLIVTCHVQLSPWHR